MLQLEEAIEVSEAKDVEDKILLEAVEAQEPSVDVLEEMFEGDVRSLDQLHLRLGALPHSPIQQGSEVF